MELPESKLKTKLLQLQMTVSRTEKILQTESQHPIARQQTALETITTEIELLKGEVEAKKITDKEDPDEIEKWIGEIEVQLAKADEEVKRLQQWQDQITREGKQREREEQLHHEHELYEAKIKLKSELKLSSENVGTKDELQYIISYNNFTGATIFTTGSCIAGFCYCLHFTQIQQIAIKIPCLVHF